MIYNENTKSFIKLETALKELGFDQQTIDLALEYLDITNPRNNELMRKITTRYYLLCQAFQDIIRNSVSIIIVKSLTKPLKARYQTQAVMSLKSAILFSAQWQQVHISAI